MRGGIFKKYFLFTSAVILVSIISLGAVLLLISSQYFVKNQKESMINQFEGIKSSTLEIISEDGMDYYLINDLFASSSVNQGLYIFLTDEKGDILVSSNEIIDDSQRIIPSDMLLYTTKNPTYFYNKMGGYFDSDHHNVGSEIIVKDSKYYIFISAPDKDKNSFLIETMKVSLVVTICILILFFIILYFITIRIVKPLKRITSAAKSYAKGDFSQKIIVKEKNEISELADALNDMSISLANLEKIRKSFIANVSHELRTPMTSISGFVDGLLDGTIPQDKQRIYLEIVSQETKRLSRLVASMLNIAKIESGETTLNKKVCNIIDLTVNCLVTFEKQINDKNIEIDGLDNGENLVYADVDLIYQVVYNLIENAIKFTNKGGYIKFSAYNKDNMFYYSIRNSGEGINESELSLVFDRFYKSDQSRSKDKTGVGLGLYIASSIINMHGGKIMVHSIEGEYTEFIFNIPKKQ